MSATLPIQTIAKKNEGQWITFRTPNGLQRGILERVEGKRALIKMPYAEAPLHLLMGNGHDFEQVAYYAPGGVGYGPGIAQPYGGFPWAGWWFIWIPLIILAAAVFCW